MPKYVPTYAEAAELGQAKTLRENLHNTTMAVDSILNFSLKPAPPLETDLSPKEKATNYFADTICEFSEQLTPYEVYQCLKDAIEKHYQYTKKEYDSAFELRRLFTGPKND